MTKTERIECIAKRLNEERAGKNIGFKIRRGRIVGFSPCEKSLVYLAGLCRPGECRPDALNDVHLAHICTESVTLELHNTAALLPCECHPGLTANDLFEMEFQI